MSTQPIPSTQLKPWVAQLDQLLRANRRGAAFEARAAVTGPASFLVCCFSERDFVGAEFRVHDAQRVRLFAFRGNEVLKTLLPPPLRSRRTLSLAEIRAAFEAQTQPAKVSLSIIAQQLKACLALKIQPSDIVVLFILETIWLFVEAGDWLAGRLGPDRPLLLWAGYLCGCLGLFVAGRVAARLWRMRQPGEEV
jgi:hypothetical protein